nr:uncharacterized mitochondrial protein AtMg00810-like [Tanacetum cinerariifolium]
MTGDKGKFRDLNMKVQGHVKFGNGSKVRIEGKGTIVFQCKNGEHRKLHEVYYIPDLCSNIISIGQLSECGDEIKIKEPYLWVHDKTGRLLMKIQRSPNHEALEVFKNFRKKVETETGENVKILRTDGGGEFLSNQFTMYCNETGLERHYTSPYSPQQNGVVERRNRTLVEMVRSNLKTMDVVFDEEKAWVWEKSTKIKATPGMSFTVEGFNHEEPFEDEFDPESSSPLSGSSHGSPQVDSRGGAPKRFYLLIDLYNQTEEIELPEELMMIQSNEEPVTYAEASKRREWVKRDPSGNILKYKARIVAKGFSERKIRGGETEKVTRKKEKLRRFGVISRFMEKPTQAVKRILRYVKGTLDYGLTYTKGESKVTITGYTDSDLANDVNDRRSTGGMAFYVNGNLVTWASQKQRCVALSSCEAEFMAATMAACKGIWLRRILTNLTGQNIPPVIMHVDNRSALDLMKNHVFHGRSKHIDIRFHFIRECVENGEITVTHVSGKKQKADLLTKPLARVKHKEMRDLIGVKKIGSSELREKMLK